MTTAMELLYLVAFLLLTRPGVTFGDNSERLVVMEGSDVVLPCSINNTDLNYELFDWRKDDQRNVFMYDPQNEGHGGQDPQFKGRVSHFEDELQNGNASIKIRNTKLEDSGDYSCDFPNLQNQTFHIELVVGPVVVVKEGSDAVLPCSLGQTDLTYQTFDWKKDGDDQKEDQEVFLYDADIYYNNSQGGQGPQYEGRVSHFQDELRNGNASIKISETKVNDSGVYSCIFPNLQNQTFHIELVVGASPELCVTTLTDTKSWSLLQCEVRGASPKPTVEWRDSSGNIVPAEEPRVTERGGSFDIILQTTVNKTDRYRCVATQDQIKHQVHAETDVYISGPFSKTDASPKPSVKILNQTKSWSLLQCEVHEASPKPTVEWWDSSRKTVPAEEPQVTERGGSYDISLQTTVTKTDHYQCVSIQEDFALQVYAVIFVHISDPDSQSGDSTVWKAVAAVVSVLFIALLGYVVYTKYHKKQKKNEESTKSSSEKYQLNPTGQE